MSEISANAVKELRDISGAGMMDCKKALSEASGNLDKAMDILRKSGIAKAQKKSGRSTKEGMVYSYIHPGSKLGVLLEINCETDFVAKTEDFINLNKDLAMHIAALRPVAVDRDELDANLIEKERSIYQEQAKNEGKPDHIAEKIVDGRLEKYYQEVCLLEQAFVKNQDQTISDLVTEMTAKIGEKISIRRFACYRLGEE